MKKLPLRMVNAAQTPLPTGEADRRRRAERGAALRNPLTRRAPRGTLSPRERAFRGTVAALSIVVCAFLSGCPKQADKAATIGGDVHAQGGAAAPKVTNRIPVPQSVRDNLGITFAKIERRKVASTVRYPGRFEAMPEARRVYVAPLDGRVAFHVQQYANVDGPTIAGGKPLKGTHLFDLDSPAWREMQQELGRLEAATLTTNAAVTVIQATRDEVEKAAKLAEKRLVTLAGVGEKRAEIEAEVQAKRNFLPRLDAEIASRKAEHEAALSTYERAIAAAGSLHGVSVDVLTAKNGKRRAMWTEVDKISVYADDFGVVDKVYVTEGEYVPKGTPVFSVLNQSLVRLRARALQNDIGKLKDGMTARILSPSGGAFANEASLEGTLIIAPESDADERTVDLIVTPKSVPQWARAGVAAQLEVTLDETAEEVLAIPAACLIQDELELIYFRRNPDNPNEVIRIKADDLGISDGKWVEIKSGVAEGDEIVLNGVYELKLTGSGKAPKGGHFHADGTFHEGADHH